MDENKLINSWAVEYTVSKDSLVISAISSRVIFRDFAPAKIPSFLKKVHFT